MLPMPLAVVARRYTIRTLAVGVLLSLGALAAMPLSRAESPPASMRIGIIGTGKIGGALARHWSKAGYEIMVSSRHPEELKSLVAELGPRVRAGTPKEAAAFGTVVLISIPYAAMPQIGQDLHDELAGKVILDTSNPIERRDGPMAVDAQKKGAGVATAEYLQNERVVRAFNCIPAASLAGKANRQPERIAIPIGGDDPQAIAVAQQLVRDAGFDPVVVGSLARTRDFDLGQPLASGQLSATQLRSKLTR